MQDITNNLNNVGKPLSRREFDFRFTFEELSVLVALAQNPHDNYRDTPGFMKVAEAIWDEANESLNYHRRRFSIEPGQSPES